MPNSQNPSVPNFVPGVGRLVTDRYDFENHILGNNFRHQASQIDISPLITINGSQPSTVQAAIVALNNFISSFMLVTATTTTPGIIQLSGDLNGVGTSFNSPKVSGLQGRPIQNASPVSGQVLLWNGSFWTPSTITDSSVNSVAAIQGTKIVPSFGSQNISTTGTLSAGMSTLGASTLGGNTAVNSLKGSLAVTTRTITSTYVVDSTASATDFELLCDTTSSAFTVTLPVPTNGRLLVFKDISGNFATNNLTIVRHGSEKIEGLSSNYIVQTGFASLKLTSNGTDWFFVG